jgi:hypothetical protein
MKVFKTCNSIPVYNFYQTIDTGDHRYLIKAFNDEDDSELELDDEKSVELSLIFNKILSEYSELIKDTKVIANYNNQLLIKKLQVKYDFCIRIIEIYKDTGVFEVVGVLSIFGWAIRKENVEQDLEKIQKKLIGMANKLRIYKARYVKKNESEDEEENANGRNLVAEALNLESVMDLKYSLDIYTVSIKKWEAIKVSCKEKIRLQNKMLS